jgi:hypothetical protein
VGTKNEKQSTIEYYNNKKLDGEAEKKVAEEKEAHVCAGP